MKAILYKSGIPVELTDLGSNAKFDIEGFLMEFSFNEVTTIVRYCFYFKSDFKKVDQKRKDLNEGFYREDMFVKYIHDKDAGANIGIPSVDDMIYKFKFDFTYYSSLIVAGNTISVPVTNFGIPYNFFYDRIIYNINIQNLPDNSGIMTYVNPILDGFTSIDYILKLPSPSYYTKQIIQVYNQNNSPGFHFYARNIGNFINLIVSDNEKRKFKKIVILIIFKIREIIGNSNNNLNGFIDGIIPNIMNNVGFTDIDLEALANSSNIINFDNYQTQPVDAIKKLIFLLKKSWGYYYVPQSTLLHRGEVPELFNSTSSYSDFEYYYIGLKSFYKTLYREPISNIPNFLKFEMLLQFLPINALSILPLTLFKDILFSFIRKRKLAEDEKRFVVRLVKSISITNANVFLDFLIESSDGIHTNYELIYYILGDARIEDYVLANNIADEIKTRKLYVFAILDLWQSSKYNFYFVPNGTTPLSENVNPNAFFLQNPIEFKEKNILTFTSIVNPALGSNRVSFVDTTFEAKMNCDRIEITKVERKKNIYTNNLFVSATAAALSDGNPQKEIFGSFQLFHPIYLMGYKANYELEMSDNNYVPAFLFQYIKEFDDINDFDASVNLLIQIGIEVGLAYFTGGLSSLRHLNHLKHSYKIYPALINSALASEQILVFSGFEALSNGIAITGSIFFSFNNYLVATENDPTLAQRRAELSNILLYIVLASAAGSIFFRYKAIRAADAFLDSIPAGAIPADIQSLLMSLRNQKASNILSIRQKINDLQLDATNNVLVKFDNYAADVKEALWFDFKNISLNDWKILNQSNAIAIDRWKDLFNRVIFDRKFLNVIASSSKTDAIISYYTYTQLKSILEPLDDVKRWRFLQEFKIDSPLQNVTFNKMVNSPIRLELSLAHLDDIKQGANILTKDDIRIILNSDANNLIVEYKIFDIKGSLKKCSQQFDDIANRELILNTRLTQIHTGIFDDINITGLSSKRQRYYVGASKLLVKIQPYNGVNASSVIFEKYIAGFKTPQRVFGEINMNAINLPHNFKDFDFYLDYDIFSIKGIDIDEAGRFKDAEKKFIFNFINEHWNTGDRFVIELESTIDICSSCEGYLTYLKQLGAKHGKTIEYKIISNPLIKETKDLN